MHFDSSLVSEGINLSKRHLGQWKAEVKHFRAVRGDVIVRCFEIEQLINFAIADLLLPVRSLHSPIWLRRRHDDFQTTILAHFDLRMKIDALHLLLSRRLPRHGKQVNDLLSTLRRVKIFRNNVAHCPVHFQAIKRKNRPVMLATYLDTSKGSVRVTEALIAAFSKDVDEAETTLNRLMGRVHRIRRRIEVVDV